MHQSREPLHRIWQRGYKFSSTYAYEDN